MTAMPDTETRAFEARVVESHVGDATADEVAGLRAGLTGSRLDLERSVQRMAISVSGDDLGWAPDDEIAEALLSVTALKRQIEAISAQLAVRVANGTTFASEGFRSGPVWLRARTNESLAGARRVFDHADWVETVPHMAEAWREGSVSVAHVKALVEAHRCFPRVAPAMTACEDGLVALAKDLDPGTFARVLHAKLLELDPRAMDDADSKKRKRDVGLHVSATIGGFVAVNGLLPPEIGQQLINALTSVRDLLRTSPAEQADEAAREELKSQCTDPHCTSTNPEGWPCRNCQDIDRAENPDAPEQPERRLSQINVDALALILDSAASATGDFKLPDIGGARPVVQITIPSESLIADGAAAPGWITSLTGQQVTPVSASTARRLACDSVRQLLLLDPRGHLDAISAMERVIPIPMRKAITSRDGGRCRFPGCRHAIREIHHVQFWQHGGTTTTDNLVGLCSFHHHQIHDRGWTLTGDPDDRLTFTDPLKRQWHSEAPRLTPPSRQ